MSKHKVSICCEASTQRLRQVSIHSGLRSQWKSLHNYDLLSSRSVLCLVQCFVVRPNSLRVALK
ncbi:MAG TPA: hypothetical protein V6C95_05400, partial [Coleofasciculaceae cyanobacterium]